MTKPDLFFGTSGPRDARCLIVGEAWGEEEARQQRAFQGQSGILLSEMLSEAGISRDECLCTNLFRGRPGFREFGAKANDFWQLFRNSKDARNMVPWRGLWPLPELVEELHILYKLIDHVQPDIIVGCGNYASWALSNGWTRGKATVPTGVPSRAAPVGITSWRGSQLEHTTSSGAVIPFVPIIHPSAIERQWSFRARTVHDLKARVLPILRGEKWVVPELFCAIENDYKQTAEILDFLIADAPTIVGDIETFARHITIVGLAWSPADAIAILFTHPDGTPVYTREQEIAIRLRLRQLFSDPTKSFCFQNAAYDVPFLEREFTWPLGRNPDWDTMIFQHTILPGTPKSLEFLASLYCKHFVYWKDESPDWNLGMDMKSELLYNCKDTTATFEIMLAQQDLMHELHYETQWADKLEELALSLDMTRAGFPFDNALAADMRRDILAQMAEYERFFNGVMPDDMVDFVQTKTTKAPWYSSPTQQMKIFFDLLHFPEVLTRAKKSAPAHRTIDDEALRKLERVDPIITPISRALREYRSMASYYGKELGIQPDPDGCVRSTFGLMNVNFRWNSKTNPWNTGGNMQNISRGKDKG